MAVRRGADYIKALRDGREVWHAGQAHRRRHRTTGFTGTIKTLADMYDKQHTPEYRDIMTCEHEGERISYSYCRQKIIRSCCSSGAISNSGRNKRLARWGAIRNSSRS